MPDPALARIAPLLGRYRGRGVLLDSNVLVVYVVGRADRRLVRRLAATKDFDGKDAAFLSAIVASVGGLVATPHVLAEVNGLLNVGGLGQLRYGVLGAFAEVLREVDEVYQPGAETPNDPAFRHLGLTDTAVLALAAKGPLVVSKDGGLCNELWSRGAEALYYNRMA